MTMRSLNRLKALMLILTAVFFAAMLINGRLYFYVGPRFSWLALMAVCLLILLAGSYNLVLSDHEPRAAQEVSDDLPVEHGAIWPILIAAVPLFLAVVIPAHPLGASAVPNRGVSTAFSARDPSVFAADPSDRTVLDWVAAMSSNTNPAALNGQKADVIGFVYRDVRFGTDQFMVTRFTITCCVADALAIGIVVSALNASQFPADSWVRVKGTFSAGTLDAQPLPILVADDVSPIQPPEQPYLYP